MSTATGSITYEGKGRYRAQFDFSVGDVNTGSTQFTINRKAIEEMMRLIREKKQVSSINMDHDLAYNRIANYNYDDDTCLLIIESSRHIIRMPPLRKAFETIIAHPLKRTIEL